MRAEDFFAGKPKSLAVYRQVQALLQDLGPVSVRVSKSQVAFRRRRGFVYLWNPQQYLPNARADLVLSLALTRHDRSGRFKQVVHPTERIWMHHLEIHDVADIDQEVAAWLREAADAAN